MSKWIKISKSYLGLSASAVLFDKICFYAGRADHWSVGVEINFYDRSLTFKLLNLYAGVEIWHAKPKDEV